MSATKKRRASFIDDADSGEEAPSKSTAKKTKTAAGALGSGQDADGQPYWEISGKRRVGLSKFSNMLMVNIREYYEANGELKPGKKGISLPIEQYQALLKCMPAINKALRKAGHEIEDPLLNGRDHQVSDDVHEQSEDEKKPIVKKEKKARSQKSNIEVTSDEEDD